MSEQNIFDGFDDFEVSSKANYRKQPVEKVKQPKAPAPYNVKFDFAKRKIIFNRDIYQEINLAENSLVHAASRSKGRVAIIVVPGKQGLFGKGVTGKAKGNAFKNRKLAEDLVDLNLTSGKYKMEYMGIAPAKVGKKTVEGCLWYTLSMYGDPQIIDLSQPDDENSAEESSELFEVTSQDEKDLNI